MKFSCHQEDIGNNNTHQQLTEKYKGKHSPADHSPSWSILFIRHFIREESSIACYNQNLYPSTSLNKTFSQDYRGINFDLNNRKDP